MSTIRYDGVNFMHYGFSVVIEILPIRYQEKKFCACQLFHEQHNVEVLDFCIEYLRM